LIIKVYNKCILKDIQVLGDITISDCWKRCPLLSSVCCPRCSSNLLYKDGLRRLAKGEKVQRNVCRNCGYRFSEKPLQKNLKWGLNNQTSLQYNNQICALEAKNLEPQAEIKTVAGESSLQDAKGKIVEFSFWQLKQGYSKATITGRVKLLYRLMRLGTNFSDEESVKQIIAEQKWSISRKVNAVDAYNSLLQMLGKTWKPPIYKRVRKLPFIPAEAEIDQLIAGTSPRISTYLQLLKETGMRCGEASQLKWTDIDFISRSVRITPEKGSNPRLLPLSIKLVDMLNSIPKDKLTVFAVNADMMRRNYNKQRKQIVYKLKNPRLTQITFHTFRHWKVTMEYRKTKDILHVKQVLGHKSLDNTMLYTQLIDFKDDEFTAVVAHSEEEACKLIEDGFDFVCDYNGNKIFRKRK
jgi:integrase